MTDQQNIPSGVPSPPPHLDAEWAALMPHEREEVLLWAADRLRLARFRVVEPDVACHEETCRYHGVRIREKREVLRA